MELGELNAEDRDDDEFVAGLRRKSALRLILVGLAIAAVGAMFVSYGRYYAKLQEQSLVQFALPEFMNIAGLVGIFIGGSLVATGTVRRILLPARRRHELPVAIAKDRAVED